MILSTKQGILFLSFIIAGFALNGCIPQKSLETASEIHDQVLTVDSHIDWPINQLFNPDFNPSIRHNPQDNDAQQWDLIRMEEGGLDAVFMSIFTSQKERTDKGQAKAKEKAIKMVELTKKMIAENSNKVELALTPEDAYRLEKLGKRAIFMGMENGYPLGKNLENVNFFENQGIRYITLTHIRNNELGDSSTDERQEWGGLSPFGKQVVKEMNRLGIMVDVSHVHDDTFWDVIALSKAPIIASHSSARAIRNHPRNLSDEMLKAIAENGGVVQICLLDDYIKEMKQSPEREAALKELEAQRQAFNSEELTQEQIKTLIAKRRQIDQQFPKNQPTVADAVDHIDHMVKVMGIDHVGIASDFDGGGGLKGIEDVSQMPNLTQELLARGYSSEEIRQIWGGNLMRVFTEVQQLKR